MADTAGFLNPPPELTVILAAIDDYATVFEAIRAIEEQTAIDQLELLVVLDSMAGFSAPADFATRHPRARVIEVGRPLMLNEARAIGLDRASADYIFLLEDHCLPTRDCMEKIILRIREGCWAAIGPAIACGNRHSIPGKAANLLTYGEWMGFERAEERRYITGYSSAWRCASLRQLAPHLEQELAIPSRLQQRLRASGERLFFEPGAVMVHWEASYLGDVCRILFRQGMAMGFIRRGSAPLASKVLASWLVPALALHRAVRGGRAWLRTGTRSLPVLSTLPVLALVWSTGELWGYWSREAGLTLRWVSDVERKRQPFINGVREPIRRPWATPEDVELDPSPAAG